MSDSQPTLSQIWWQLFNIFKKKLKELARDKYKVLILIIIVAPVLYYLGNKIISKIKAKSSQKAETTHILSQNGVSSATTHNNNDIKQINVNLNGNMNGNMNGNNMNGNVQQNEAIDYMALAESIKINHNERLNGYKQGQKQAKEEQNETIDYEAIVAGIEQKSKAKEIQDSLEFDASAYAQFLEESGQVEEVDEQGQAVGLAQEDDLEEQGGMERVTRKSSLEKKLKKNELLMILNEDEDAWEAWNVLEVDDVKSIVHIKINGGDKQSHFWMDDLENKLVYRMTNNSDNISMSDISASDHFIDDDKENNHSCIKQNCGQNGHNTCNKANGHSNKSREDKKKSTKASYAKGFQPDKDYSNCVIKDRAGNMWRVDQHYNRNTSKAELKGLRSGEEKEVYLNQMAHTLPFN